MKAKILIVIPDAELGGVTSSAVNFCTEMVGNGYNVDVLVMNGSDLPLQVEVGKIRLRGLAKFWKLGFSDLKKQNWWLIPFLLFISAIKKITIRINLWYPFVFSFYKVKGEYDAVIAYRQCAPCYYLVTHCVKSTKKIGMIHGDWFARESYSSWDYMMHDLTHVACVSNACRDAWKTHYPGISQRFLTIYNMFNVKGIIDSANKQEDFHFETHVINLVTVARVENYSKRIDRIPYACQKLKALGFNRFHWYVVGDGPDFDIDRQLAEKMTVNDVLTFCGRKNNPFPYLKQADLFVLTSSCESYGMVIKEAFILGKPVVAMRYPALSEIVNEGVNGLIADQSVDSLVDCISKMLDNDSQLLKKMTLTLKEQHVSNSIALGQFESIFK